MDVIGGELGFMAVSAGKAFLTLMEPHRLMFLALGCSADDSTASNDAGASAITRTVASLNSTSRTADPVAGSPSPVTTTGMSPTNVVRKLPGSASSASRQR